MGHMEWDTEIRENAPTRDDKRWITAEKERLVPRRYSDPRLGSGIVKEDDKTWSLESGAGCECGRSPTGSCVGWHNLTEEQYDKTLKEYLDTPDSDKHSFLKPKNKKKLTKDEAFNAIVEGLNIMAEGLGNPDIDLPQDINQDSQDEILRSTGKRLHDNDNKEK
jgi:hypothetical protein